MTIYDKQASADIRRYIWDAIQQEEILNESIKKEKIDDFSDEENIKRKHLYDLKVPFLEQKL